MASLVLFLCFCFVMFQAGYHWREWSGNGQAYGYTRDETQLDSMIGKI